MSNPSQESPNGSTDRPNFFDLPDGKKEIAAETVEVLPSGGVGQHGGAREGAGRPRTDPAGDAANILHDSSHRLLVVLGGATYGFNHRGLLVDLSRKNEAALAVIADLMPEIVTKNHLDEVRGSVQAFASTHDSKVRSEPITAIDNRIPILPTKTGGYDLRTGGIVSPQDMAAYLQTDRGYDFTPPPDTIPKTKITDAVWKLWGQRVGRLASRWAAHLLNAQPVIDVAVGESGAGKGTAISLLRRSFPNMVEVLPVQKALGSQGRKWSVVEDALSKALIVIIDEADKTPDKPVDAGQVNSWVDGVLTRRRLFENVETKPRLGTVSLVGGDYPSLPFDAQGMDRRFQAVYRLPGTDGDGFLSKQEWFWLNDTASDTEQAEAVGAFRWLMVQECRRLAGLYDLLAETAGEAEIAERDLMFDAMKAPDIAALQDAFAVDNTQTGFVPSSRIVEVIQDATGSKPSTAVIAKRLRAAFPDAPLSSASKRDDEGKQVRGWRGIASTIT